MTMTLIETKTLSSTATSIEFANVPQDSTDLLLVLAGRYNTTEQAPYLALNNSTSNFTSRSIVGVGNTVYTESRTDNFIGYAINWSTTTANTFSSLRLYIPNYTSSANKSFSVDYVTENNATDANAGILAGLWSNTAAITSVKINAAAATSFQIGTIASLYKIKKA